MVVGEKTAIFCPVWKKDAQVISILHMCVFVLTSLHAMCINHNNKCKKIKGRKILQLYLFQCGFNEEQGKVIDSPKIHNKYSGYPSLKKKLIFSQLNYVVINT